jgi:hypothetical protein
MSPNALVLFQKTEISMDSPNLTSKVQPSIATTRDWIPIANADTYLIQTVEVQLEKELRERKIRPVVGGGLTLRFENLIPLTTFLTLWTGHSKTFPMEVNQTFPYTFSQNWLSMVAPGRDFH